MKIFIKKLSAYFGNITWVNFSLVSFLFSILSFGILIFSLKNFMDDWPILYSARLRGLEGLQQYYSYGGRPLGYWVNAFFVSILGFQPLGWHIGALLLRWVSSILMWGIFSSLWPEYKRQVTWAALLFLVYPLFAQQSLAVTFMPHWVCYILYFLSVLLMVTAYKKRKTAWLWPLIIISMALDMVNLFTYEYFIGVEMLRPVILWLLISQEPKTLEPKKEYFHRARKTFFFWLPFLITSLGFIAWRLWQTTQPIGQVAETPTILFAIFKTPLNAIFQLLQFVWSDFNQIVFSVWSHTFAPAQLDFRVISDFLGLGVMLIALGLGLVYVLYFTKPAPAEQAGTQPANQGKWYRQALPLGALGVLLGAVPGWLVGRTTSDSYGLWNDRFGMVSMFGAAIFIVALLEWLLKGSYKKQAVIFCLLIALATNTNYRTANEFRWSAIYQSRFYYQLYWRAPYIKSPTALYADNEFFSKMGVYPTSFALNLLYPSVQPMPDVDYWFFTISKYFGNDVSSLASGTNISQGHTYALFKGWSTDALTVYFSENSNTCLWILTENDRYYPTLSPNTVKTLPASNLDRIETRQTPGYPPVDLFGPEPAHSWCYYYEKADLARQFKQWDEIPQLYEEASAKGFDTLSSIELMPFIEGFAHTGNFSKAIELTTQARNYVHDMSPYLCDNWARIIKDLPDSPEAAEAYHTITSQVIGCNP